MIGLCLWYGTVLAIERIIARVADRRTAHAGAAYTGRERCMQGAIAISETIGYDRRQAAPGTESTMCSAPIIGWRTWKLAARGKELVLQSIVVDVVWPHGRALEARDLPPKGGLTYGPGIYATKKRSELHRVMTDWPADVYGTVALWGAVSEHEHGYRAQYAYPQRLWCRDEGTAQVLRRLYGCETEVSTRWPLWRSSLLGTPSVRARKPRRQSTGLAKAGE